MKDVEHGRPRVLVIDRQREFLAEITAALEEANFGCCGCTTADEAVLAARSTPPDLIVCDVNLRSEDGREACRRVKRYPGLEGVPVVFLSGVQLPDVIRLGRNADDGLYCLRKPFAPHVLLELLDRSLAASEGS